MYQSNYEGYLIDMMQDKDLGPQITNQVMQLFELIFHIKRGYYCPKCGKEIEYSLLDQGFDGIEFYLDAEPGVYVITAYDLFNNVTSNKASLSLVLWAFFSILPNLLSTISPSLRS